MWGKMYSKETAQSELAVEEVVTARSLHLMLLHQEQEQEVSWISGRRQAESAVMTSEYELDPATGLAAVAASHFN